MALLCGFDPDDLPGVSTFYDFVRRLLDGPWTPRCPHAQRPTDRLDGSRGRYTRRLAQERAQVQAQTQAQAAHAGESVTQQEVRQVLARLDQALPEDFGTRLNAILMVVAVVPSADAGHLGPVQALHLSGDGSALASQASGRGHRACTCTERCACPRLYADPEAQWGFDSHREEFVFGDRLSLLTTSHARDLPLHLRLEGANASDVVMGIRSVEETFKAFRLHLPHARIASAAFDKGYDASAFYELLTQLHIAPLIPRARPAKTLHTDGAVEFSPEGTPLCPGSAPMRQHQYNTQTQQVLFYCPAKQRGRAREVDLSLCPLGRLCEPESPMGPTLWVAAESNRRLVLPIRRDSARFKALYAKRSGAERVFSQLKAKGASGTSRRRYMRQMRVVAHGLGMHAKAWVKARWPRLPDTIETLLAALAQLAEEAQAKEHARQQVLTQDAA